MNNSADTANKNSNANVAPNAKSDINPNAN